MAAAEYPQTGFDEERMGRKLSSTLLVIEDDDNDVFFLERTIRETGVPNPVQTVRSGTEALEYLAGQGRFSDRAAYPLPCLIFLDLHLPGMSGLEVLTWIRGRTDLASTIVVLLTGSKEEAAITTAYEIGANSYLIKPANVETLTVLLKALDLYSVDVEREFSDS
jgi:CheY-like chemotaxis protein